MFQLDSGEKVLECLAGKQMARVVRSEDVTCPLLQLPSM
jgi:hypothetical protein